MVSWCALLDDAVSCNHSPLVALRMPVHRPSLTFALRPHPEATDVHVTGTFDDWGKSVSLNKVGDIWEKEVELPKADEKILYKFVVNDKWIIDPDAPQEDDGSGNVNNVLYPDQIKSKGAVVPEALTTSSVAPSSTTALMAGQVPLEPKKEASEGMLARDGPRHSEAVGPDLDFFVVTPATNSTLTKDTTETSLPGTFPETPSNEPESVGVNPLPATSGVGNPIDLPAGYKVPPSSDVTSNTVHSTVTTSQQDYEKAGSGIPIIGGALAALGLGGAAAAASKNENLIPESSLPMGKGAADTLDAGPTISSAAPTSTTAEMAGKVPLEQQTTTTVPEVVKESIAEAHTDPEATTSSEAVKEKAEVEQELLKKIPSSNEAGEPAPTIAAATSATAPGTSSSAAAAVADGTDAKAEVGDAAKTTVATEKTEGDNTEYAPPHKAGGAPGVSDSAAAAVSDGAEDPTLADEPAVQMMNKHDAEAAGGATKQTATAAAATTTTDAPKTTEAAPVAASPKKEEPKKETTAATPSTPTKKPATTPTSSPSSSATKDKKKKNRISSLFKKIFD